MNYRKDSLPIGTVLQSGKYTYQITDILGAGNFGITYKVQASLSVENISTTINFAVKEFFLKGCYRGKDGCRVLCSHSLQSEFKSNLRAFFNEGHLLHELSRLSKNIIHVNEVFEYFGTAYYVMEYIESGNLENWVMTNGPFEEQAAIDMIGKVCDAVEFIHDKHLLHLDIKPSNILLSYDPHSQKVCPVLMDFGLAKQFDTNDRPKTSIIPRGATDGYAPKEQYGEISHFNPSIDVYSLAATLFYLLTGSHPKSAFDIKPQDIVKELGTKASVKTRNAILRGMHPDSSMRTPSAGAFMQTLMYDNHAEMGIDIPLNKNTNVFEKNKNQKKKTEKRKIIIKFASLVSIATLTVLLVLYNCGKEKVEKIEPSVQHVAEKSDSTALVLDTPTDSMLNEAESLKTSGETIQSATIPPPISEKPTQKNANNKRVQGGPSTTKSNTTFHPVTQAESSTAGSSSEQSVHIRKDNSPEKVSAEEKQRREEAEELLRQHEITRLLKK